MYTIKKLTLLPALLCGILTFCSLAAAANRPNIILFYIDDWAWYGSPGPMNDSMKNSMMPILEMPNVEKLAQEGMKFTNAYGAPQCAPARVCVQTGQSAARSGFTVVLGKIKDDYYDTRRQYQNLPMIPNVSDVRLDEDAVTIPKALKPLGYASAHVGKWHMYCDPGEAGYIVHDGETTNKEGNQLSGPVQIPDDMDDPKLMFSMTKKGIDFIEDQTKKGNPFYLQISHYAMHSGSECLPETREKYAKHPLVKAYYKKNDIDPDSIKRNSDPAVWLAMGEDMDTSIGMVLDKLEALGIADNTYAIVVSDNGYRHKELHVTPGMTQPLHSHKWWVWNGGIRVPMIVKGPGIKAGSVFTGNVVNYDFLPTFVDWAGGDPGKLSNIDGVSLKAYMEGKKPEPAFLNRYLYFHFPHYRVAVPHSAFVSGNAKVMHFYEKPEIPMLFDLSGDPGEVSNIARQYPETHKRLFDEMMRYFGEVGARMPKKNPDYDPKVYKSMKGYSTRVMWGPFEGKRPLEDDES